MSYNWIHEIKDVSHVYQTVFSDRNELHIDAMRVEGRLSNVYSVLAFTRLSGSIAELKSSSSSSIVSFVIPEPEHIPKGCSKVTETTCIMTVELQYSIARLAILASFPLLPHFGIILAPSTPILMAIALQTSCIYRAPSIDLRKTGNAVFYHS